MTVEQELKLHVPQPSRQALKEIVNTAAAKTIHLHAFYFDTCERELAQAGIALRLRKENGIWIQTIKLPGDDALSKIEYNHSRPEPTLDFKVYMGTPAEQAFKQLKNDLSARFETDIYRTLRLEETPYGVLELAYDSGFIRSLNLEIPVCELELELKEGSSAAIFSVAKAWQQQYQFILDFRSKAERGDTLASTAIESKGLDSNFSLWRAWQVKDPQLAGLEPKQAAQLHLEQIARNAAVIADIDRADMKAELDLDLSEHISLLCSALQSMRLLCSTSNDKAQQNQLAAALRHYEHEFSQALPQQAKALASSSAFQACLLDILAWSIVES